ncbi:MAG: long-chain fatty acid--CoA ligase [Magnetovibrio sp.]|nr:long-chain fatty acid--CoA ligase [Magnetovibrio sp.]
MMDGIKKLCKSNASDQFYVDDGTEITYAEFFIRLEECLDQIAAQGVESASAVVVKGEFAFDSIVMLIALVANGNIVIPHTPNSYKKLEAETLLLEPDFLIDATRAPFTCKRVGNFKKSCLADQFEAGERGLVVFTSGSTGRPKAIVHKVDPLLEKFAARDNKKLRAIPFLLFDHMGGFNTILSILYGGGCIVHRHERSVDSICAAIENFKVTLLPTTPTFLAMLLVSEAWKRYDLSSLRMITYGTEVMNEVILKKMVSLLPKIRFKQTYGLSEVGVVMTSSRDNDTTWVKLSGDGIETKIVDEILWLKVKSAMLGRVIYQDNQAQFEPHQAEWFCTNDLVEVDGEYLKFCGRDSDIINVSGLKVYPGEIENCLLECDHVANATVYGKANPLVGQIVVAEIELKPGSQATSAKPTIQQHCRKHLERFKAPREIIFVDQISVSDRLKKSRKQNA